MLQIDSVLEEKYRILAVIGHGGMSTVYKAMDIATGRILAVKDVDRVKSTNGQVVVEELSLKEGQFLMKLANPHLPKIYDIIEGEKSFILVMDYIEGESLDKVIEKANGGLPEKTVCEWAKQISMVLSYLHSQYPPIIYRDLKPANIILQSNGNLVLIDFGTARTLKQDKEIGMGMTADTICMGTAGFAAPEQYGGRGQSDARTDIYCLGATLYNLLTGRLPHPNPAMSLDLAYYDPALAKSSLNSIIKKCTRPNPLERYQSAEELMEDLYAAKPRSDKNEASASSGWQQQFIKSTTSLLNGFTGLLKKKPEGEREQPTQTQSNRPVTVEPQPAEIKKSQAYGNASSVNQTPVNEVDQPEWSEEPFEQSVEDSSFQPWKRLMMVAGIAAALLLILCIVLVAADASTAGIIMLIFGIAAATLAVFGFVMYLKEKE